MIAINDTNLPGVPVSILQGKYSAFLFGGPEGGAATISQTGLVPANAHSLQVDIAFPVYGPNPFVVTLGGQALNMVPLQTFSTYTLYGANISGFAGLTEQLSFTCPAPTSNPPSDLEIDNIVFSPSSIPEPGSWAVMLCGAGAWLAAWRWKRERWGANARGLQAKAAVDVALVDV